MFSQASVILSAGRGEGQTPPGRPLRQTPPQQTATEADGPHPTGMHSCKMYLFMFCTFSSLQVILRFSCTSVRVPRWTTRRCFTSECSLWAGTLRRAKRRRTLAGSQSSSRTFSLSLSSPGSNRKSNRDAASIVRCTWRHGATLTITITWTTPSTSDTASTSCLTLFYREDSSVQFCVWWWHEQRKVRKRSNKQECLVALEFFLNGAELSLNSAISGKVINHWSMNWAWFKDSVSHMCLSGAVAASWSLTQEVAGCSPFTVMTNIFYLNSLNSVKFNI